MMVREFVFGMAGSPIAQEPLVKEQTWSAIAVVGGDGNGPTPPPEFKFPWWLVGVGAAAAVAIRTKQVLDKEKR